MGDEGGEDALEPREREREKRAADGTEKKKENCHAYSKRGFTPVWSVELAGPTEKEKKDARSFSRRATAVSKTLGPSLSIQFFPLPLRLKLELELQIYKRISSYHMYIYIYFS